MNFESCFVLNERKKRTSIISQFITRAKNKEHIEKCNKKKEKKNGKGRSDATIV